MSLIPAAYLDLLQAPITPTLTTLNPDGYPQATPVWVSYDGALIWMNTTVGRQKDRNLQRDPRLSLLAFNPHAPERWLEIRGVVAERTLTGGLEHLQQLTRAYEGVDDYYSLGWDDPAKEIRVIYKIRPVKVNWG